jgi:hypothetical protein
MDTYLLPGVSDYNETSSPVTNRATERVLGRSEKRQVSHEKLLFYNNCGSSFIFVSTKFIVD